MNNRVIKLIQAQNMLRLALQEVSGLQQYYPDDTARGNIVSTKAAVDVHRAFVAISQVLESEIEAQAS